ncbi:SMI1/KNR4 family protein [Bacillus pseudomycoides]|uniref:SMI1/KNR4 family protein n=1 Tax=Bacillus pseudomycoides TaxID=64104 RepID=UPI00211D4217|nr:SMI1/KNR4 family protein [Bacillus pseudomycoides]
MNKISIDDVKESLKSTGFDFPIDYIECVAINNRGHVEPMLFDVEGIERVFGSLLSFNPESEEFILETYDEYKEVLPIELFPIGVDPAGNLICFDFRDYGDQPRVVFWEHEGAWEKEAIMESEGITAEEAEEVARENVFNEASNFTEFLNKLHD